MDNYFFKFLVLFVIVLTFLYVISNTKEFFSSSFENCDIKNNFFNIKNNSCNKLEKNKLNKKKIDVNYQATLLVGVKDITSPNTHNILFKNIDRNGDLLELQGDSLIYVPNFTNSILFSEITFSSSDVTRFQSVIGSNNWSIDIRNSNLVLSKLDSLSVQFEYILKTNIKDFKTYTLFLKCSRKLLECYINGEKNQREGIYDTRSIMIGSNILKSNPFIGSLTNIVLFNYKPESSDLTQLETGKNLLPEKVEVIARSDNQSVELNWLVTNNDGRKTTDFYIIVYENNVGPKLIKYKNRQCENCKYRISNLENFIIYKLGVVGVNEFGVGEVSNLVQIAPGSPLDKFNIPTKAQKVVCLNNGLYNLSNRCKQNPEIVPNFSENSYEFILGKLESGKNKSFNLNIGEKIN